MYWQALHHFLIACASFLLKLIKFYPNLSSIPSVLGKTSLLLQLGNEDRINTPCTLCWIRANHYETTAASLRVVVPGPASRSLPGTPYLFVLCFKTPCLFSLGCFFSFALICFASKMECNSWLVAHSSFIVDSPFVALHFSSPYSNEHYVLGF